MSITCVLTVFLHGFWFVGDVGGWVSSGHEISWDYYLRFCSNCFVTLAGKALCGTLRKGYQGTLLTIFCWCSQGFLLNGECSLCFCNASMLKSGVGDISLSNLEGLFASKKNACLRLLVFRRYFMSEKIGRTHIDQKFLKLGWNLEKKIFFLQQGFIFHM